MKPRTVPFAEARCCRNCRYFIQHYVKTDNGNFAQCNIGHCDCLRTKTVKRNHVCDAFEARPEAIGERTVPKELLVPDPCDML